MANLETRAAKEIVRVAALWVGSVVPLILAMYFFSVASPTAIDDRSSNQAAQFDTWLALHEFFQVSNAAIFQDGAWEEFVAEIAELPLGQSLDRIDSIKQVNSGTEVKSPQNINIILPYDSEPPAEIKLVMRNVTPPVLSVEAMRSASRLNDYELVYLPDRDRIFVVPKGIKIESLRQAMNVVFRDNLARPNDAEPIIQGLRRHGWNAERPDFDDLSSGNDIVRSLMGELNKPAELPKSPTMKFFGTDLPIGWVGIAIPLLTLGALFLLVLPLSCLFPLVAKQKKVMIDDPSVIPLFLQDQVLATIASIAPVFVSIGAVYAFRRAKLHPSAETGFYDFGVLPLLSIFTLTWLLVIWIAARGKFEFQTGN